MHDFTASSRASSEFIYTIIFGYTLLMHLTIRHGGEQWGTSGNYAVFRSNDWFVCITCGSETECVSVSLCTSLTHPLAGSFKIYRRERSAALSTKENGVPISFHMIVVRIVALTIVSSRYIGWGNGANDKYSQFWRRCIGVRYSVSILLSWQVSGQVTGGVPFRRIIARTKP